MYPSPSNLIASVTHHFVAIVILLLFELNVTWNRCSYYFIFSIGSLHICSIFLSFFLSLSFSVSLTQIGYFPSKRVWWLNWVKCVGIKIHHVSYVWRFVIIWLVYLRFFFLLSFYFAWFTNWQCYLFTIYAYMHAPRRKLIKFMDDNHFRLSHFERNEWI